MPTRLVQLAAGNDRGVEAHVALRCMLWDDLTRSESLQEATQILNSARCAVLLACNEDDGSYVGFAELNLRDYAEGASSSPVGYLEGWFVLPEWRGRGVGRQLVDEGEQWARSHGCTEFASDTDLGNTGSIQAHGRLGFREVERIVCFLKPLR